MSEEQLPQYTQTVIPAKVSVNEANEATMASLSGPSKPAPVAGVRRVRKSVLIGGGLICTLLVVVGIVVALGEAGSPAKQAAPSAKKATHVPQEGEVRPPEQLTQVKDYTKQAQAIAVESPLEGSLEAQEAQLVATSVPGATQGLAAPGATAPGAPPAPKGIWAQAAENYERQQAQNFYQDKVTSRRAGLRVSLEQAPGQNQPAAASQGDEARLASMRAELDARQAANRQQALGYQSGVMVPGMSAAASPVDGVGQREQWQTQRRDIAGIEQAAAIQVHQRGVLRAGTLLELVLETAINSELPGMLRARLVRPVEDAFGGVLLPAGTMFLGEYNARVEAGSERVQLVWTRAVTPSGTSFALGSIPGTDRSGASGSSADVDRHWGELVAGALVSTLLSGGQALAQGNTNALVQTPRQAFAQGVFSSGQDTARQISQREVERSVVLRVPAGTHMAALVHADLFLKDVP